uniref:Uncharacterized protein n=1 Tax=Oryza sativa subsp. japonica TaxID=39947 RepID=Q2QW00_ORYSJ|nr:hypothetical protein LOC_Os12g11060 [Oryza sativa Japonica Group]
MAGVSDSYNGSPLGLPHVDPAIGSSGRPTAALPSLPFQRGSGSRQHDGGRHGLRNMRGRQRQCGFGLHARGFAAGDDGWYGTADSGDGRGRSASDDGGGNRLGCRKC